MPNRGWRDIIADILMITNEPKGKTAIMTGAVLSYDLLQTYLELLQDSGLLEYCSKTRKFKTTKKGLEFLRLLESMNKLVYRRES